MSGPLPSSITLRGLQSIEASAGTGKTETLGLLMLRALLEGACEPRQLLAVTFTRKATHELRERLRSVLQRAQTVLSGGGDRNAEFMAFMQSVLSTQQHDEVLANLRRARLGLDQVAIHTIHAFCQRVLGEYPQYCDSPSLNFDVLEREAAMSAELAATLWRGWMRDSEQAMQARSLWSSPQELAEDLPLLLGPAALLEVEPPVAEYRDIFRRAQRRSAEEILVSSHELEGLMSDAIVAGVLNKRAHDPQKLAAEFEALRRWAVSSEDALPDLGQRSDKSPRLKLFTSTGLQTNSKKTFTAASHPLLMALQELMQAHEIHLAAERAERTHFLALARTQAEAAWRRISRRDDVLRQDDLIRRVASAAQGPHAIELQTALRVRYRFVLVDEFQDTDALQWSIFSTVFAHREDGALLLVGDPKQAIYGFRGGDIEAYRAALRDSDGRHALRVNHRSQPALIHAVNTLYAAPIAPGFLEEGLDYVEVQPAGKLSAEDWRTEDAAAPALQLQWLQADTESQKKISKESALRRSLSAMGVRIAALLDASTTYRLRLKDEHAPRPLNPSDIAVLVATNPQVDAVLRVLREAGIPARGVGRASVYDTSSARELSLVLGALLSLRDASRLQAACATWLVGDDAVRLQRYQQGEGSAERAQRFARWRERWRSHGALALLEAVLAERPGIDTQDGVIQQRLRDLRQLANLLQGRHGQALELQHQQLLQAVHADTEREPGTQREAGGGDAVQVMTVHLSKGLQFPVVFLPTLWNAPSSKPRRLEHVYVEGQRRLGIRRDFDAPTENARLSEMHGEARRQLYVALTRASHAMWWCWAPIKLSESSALHGLLHGTQDATPLQMREALQDFAARSGAQVLEDRGDAGTPALRLAASAQSIIEPSPLRRDCRSDWWVHSFSQWHRRGQAMNWQAGDASPPAEAFAGAALGLALHDLLEHQIGLRDADASKLLQAAQRALRLQGFTETDLPQAAPLCLRLFRNAQTGRLPEDIRLCDLVPEQLRHEMEFHLSMQNRAASGLFALLAKHDVIAADRLAPAGRIEGLLTGKIDLIYQHESRYFIADYKSNWLPEYHEAALRDCMHQHEYFLQATLYTLAVHRWLRFRLGDAYDYDRDVGGVRYLFPRGMREGTGTGVLAWKPASRLIHELDAFFGMPQEPAL